MSMYDRHLPNSKGNPICGESYYFGDRNITNDVSNVNCPKCKALILQKKLAADFPNITLTAKAGRRACYEVHIDGKHVGHVNQYQGGRRPRYEVCTFSIRNTNGMQTLSEAVDGRYRQVSTYNRWQALEWITKNQDQMRTNDSLTKEREEFVASEERRKAEIEQEIKDDEMYLETLLEMKNTIPLSNIQTLALDKAIEAFKKEANILVRVSEL